jgi:hypothetical protein
MRESGLRAPRRRGCEEGSERTVLCSDDGLTSTVVIDCAQFVGAFYTSFAGFTHDVQDLLEEGDKVAFRAVARATHTGAFMAIPATGKQIAVPMIGMARIAGGKVAEWWNSPDQLGLMQQLGACRGEPIASGDGLSGPNTALPSRTVLPCCAVAGHGRRWIRYNHE